MNNPLLPTTRQRIVGTLFVADSLASADYIANIALNTILVKNLSGAEAPSVLSACSYDLVGRATRAGRPVLYGARN